MKYPVYAIADKFIGTDKSFIVKFIGPEEGIVVHAESKSIRKTGDHLRNWVNIEDNHDNGVWIILDIKQYNEIQLKDYT